MMRRARLGWPSGSLVRCWVKRSERPEEGRSLLLLEVRRIVLRGDAWTVVAPTLALAARLARTTLASRLPGCISNAVRRECPRPQFQRDLASGIGGQPCDTPRREPRADPLVAQGPCPARDADRAVSLRLDPAADAGQSFAHASPVRGRKPSGTNRRGQASTAASLISDLVRFEYSGKCGRLRICGGLLPNGGRT